MLYALCFSFFSFTLKELILILDTSVVCLRQAPVIKTTWRKNKTDRSQMEKTYIFFISSSNTKSSHAWTVNIFFAHRLNADLGVAQRFLFHLGTSDTRMVSPGSTGSHVQNTYNNPDKPSRSEISCSLLSPWTPRTTCLSLSHTLLSFFCGTRVVVVLHWIWAVYKSEEWFLTGQQRCLASKTTDVRWLEELTTLDRPQQLTWVAEMKGWPGPRRLGPQQPVPPRWPAG
jgi:hypothetical protein